MSPKISAALLADPDLAETVLNLQSLISRRFLPGLGPPKRALAEYERGCSPLREIAANTHGVHSNTYAAEKTKLFCLVSAKLGRGASPTTSEDIIRAVNEIAVLYFLRRMWRRVSMNKYSSLAYVALVTIFLSAAAPAIYAGLSDGEKSGWVVAGTIVPILCDIMEATAIEFTIIFTAKTARELLYQLILPFMGLAKFGGKIVKVGGSMSLEAAGDVAGEAVLMYRRWVAVAHSQPTWNVVAGRGSGAGSDDNWLSAEEELIVMGLVLEHDHRG